MSLDLCVGLFATMDDLFEEDPDALPEYRQVFADFNTLLRAAGLPEHHEREDLVGDLGWIEIPWSSAIGKHSTLQSLRRFYAHVLDRRATNQAAPIVLPEALTGRRATDDALLRHAYESDSIITSPFHGSHLIQHADHEGYYVPVDFPKVLGPHQVPSLDIWERLESNLGSSFGLCRECRDAATLLELDLTQADLRTDAMGAFLGLEDTLRALPGNEQPIWLSGGYTTEALACWVLYHGSLASIRTGLALCFV